MMNDRRKKVQRLIGDRNEAQFKQKGDTYVTPVEAVYPIERLMTPVIWECACGNGAIAEVLKECFSDDDVIATDLHDWGYGESGVDYLATPPPDGVKTIITNPPFSLFNEFLRKGLEDLYKGVERVFFLAPLRYLSSQKRRNIFLQPCFSGVHVFSRRLPRMNAIDYEGKKTTSMMDFAWYEFSSLQPYASPTIRFLDWKEWIP